MALHSHHFRIEAPLQAGSYDKAAVQARIQREITSAPVVFYSYSLSPFCTQTKELGGWVGIGVGIHEVLTVWPLRKS